MATAIITALAALTRLMNLGSPTDAGTPIFDEKHYAPQAWQVLHNYGVEDNPGFGLVVHPPMGKQLIAFGEALFGYNGVGWRFTSAVLGVVLVALVGAHRAADQPLDPGRRGGRAAADRRRRELRRGAHRAAGQLPDVFRRRGVRRLDRRSRPGPRANAQRAAGGPHRRDAVGSAAGRAVVAVRCGRAAGSGVRDEVVGLYYIAFFGAMSLAFDIAARRAYRVPRPWFGAIRRDLGPTAYVFLLIPFAVYLASYAPWFSSETAVNRYEVGQSIGEREWYQPPDAIRSLWHYTYKAYHFHSTLTNSAGNHHPWESKPWTWPMSLRPVLYAIDNQNVPGCGAASCVKAVMLVGTPAMWWLAVPVLIYALWRAFVRRDWRYAVVLAGYGAGFLPWFADIDRQMYFFYAVPMAPFLVMAIALILGDILHAPNQNAERRTLGLIVVSCYVALVITNFAWLYPVLTGVPISQSTWNMEIWLPSWR